MYVTSGHVYGQCGRLLKHKIPDPITEEHVQQWKALDKAKQPECKSILASW